MKFPPCYSCLAFSLVSRWMRSHCRRWGGLIPVRCGQSGAQVKHQTCVFTVRVCCSSKTVFIYRRNINSSVNPVRELYYSFFISKHMCNFIFKLSEHCVLIFNYWLIWVAVCCCCCYLWCLMESSWTGTKGVRGKTREQTWRAPN